MRRVGTLVLGVFLAGCAARAPIRDDTVAIAQADALVRQGCHACLLEARDLFAGLRQPALRAAMRPRLFEIDLLIVLREKELAIDSAPALARAQSWIPDLPESTAAGRFAEIVAALPPDARGTPIRDRLATPQPPASWTRDSQAWLATTTDLPLLRDYLMAALSCLLPDRAARGGGPADSDAAELPSDAAPLLVYRRAVCPTRLDASRLEQIADTVPRFVETALFLARTPAGTEGSPRGVTTRARLREAFGRLPQSAAIAHELGGIMMTHRDRRAAAEYYSAVLSLRDRHEEARIGRGIAYGYLDRSDEAIADLTRIIDEAAPLRNDAYYWRAWNHHRRGDLDPARADIERAKAMGRAPYVLTLAGIIEYEQRDLGIARGDLSAAIRSSPSDCTAHWYLALVELAEERWLDGAAAFGHSSRCYADSAAVNERQRDLMAARTDVEMDPAFRAAQIANFELAIAEDRSQESAAAFNAAVNYARGGDRASAVRYLEQAEQDAARQEVSQQLRTLLDATQSPDRR